MYLARNLGIPLSVFHPANEGVSAARRRARPRATWPNDRRLDRPRAGAGGGEDMIY